MNDRSSRAVYVAAGSNIDAHRHLRQALALLREQFPDLVASGAYANAAVGFSGEDFVNLVVGFTTTRTLPQLLECLHVVETACGRPRDAAKWAPRSMDLDVLLFGDVVGEYPGAKLPRPATGTAAHAGSCRAGRPTAGS